MSQHICGIQQVGIGTANLQRDWKWYRKMFNMNIRVFEDAAEAPLMTRYTGMKVQKRVAALAMNMGGGGGFEIWQYASRTPQSASFDLQLGDLGILAIQLKTERAETSYAYLKEQGAALLTPISVNPAGQKHFWVSDGNGYWFDIVESSDWFKQNEGYTGGVAGVVIGVSNLNDALAFYSDFLGYDQIIGRNDGVQEDLAPLPGGEKPLKRLLLRQSRQAPGPFNPLLGQNTIELVQLENGGGRRIFANRYWGDLGFIHLCFDVKDMSGLKQKAAEAGFPFTVDSAESFDMGKAAGRFGYVEDPDGTLIEFVETHKLPIVEKWGWYVDLRKRRGQKPLPNWLLSCFRFNKVKD